MPKSQVPLRVFHVISFLDSEIQACLNALRFVANTSEKMEAHITFGGPFPNRRSLPDGVASLEGAWMEITGVGKFFGDTQHTVFLEGKSPDLERFQSIRDYEFHPHITLYNGGERAVAEAILNRLEKLNLRVPLQLARPRQHSSPSGHQKLELAMVYEAARESLSLNLPEAPPSEWDENIRLGACDTILSRLSGLATRAGGQNLSGWA